MILDRLRRVATFAGQGGFGAKSVHRSIDKLRRVAAFAKTVHRQLPSVNRPRMRETLAAASSSLSGLGAYNPDDLITNKGYAVYDQMQRDAQVVACLNVKKLAVLSRGWEAHPASDSPEDAEVADFVRFCLQDMRGSILDALYKSMDALAKGFSICEINYKVIESGPFAGRIGLASIKAKDPATVSFRVDEYSNVTGLKGVWDLVSGTSSRNTGGAGEAGELPAEKFVIYTYLPRYESPYGQSDLRAAYTHWWAKHKILEFYNTYLEKYGSPTALGVYRRSSRREQQDDLLSAISSIQQRSAITIPDDVQVSLLEAQRGGEAGYLQAIEYHDRQIAKAILGQTLTTEEGVRTGSYAQAKVHLQVMRYQLEKLKRDLEESVVGEQIIRRLVDYNYVRVESYPKFCLGNLEDRDLAALGDLITKLIDRKVIAPDERWIREYLGVVSDER